LLGAAAVATVPTAGCSGALGEGTDGSDGDPDGVRLDEFSVRNAHGSKHRVQLAVEADGEMLHLGAYDLDGGGDRTVDGAWADTPGSYRIHVTLDGGAVRTADIVDSVGSEASCARVLIRIGTDGELGIWTGASCGPDADGDDLGSV